MKSGGALASSSLTFILLWSIHRHFLCIVFSCFLILLSPINMYSQHVFPLFHVMICTGTHRGGLLMYRLYRCFREHV